MSSYKRLNGIENYGAVNASRSSLLDVSGDVELEDDEEEELQFKKPRRISTVTVFRYFGATVCLIIMVLSCECSCYCVLVSITSH